ncbi:hypothetical protein [Glutamicibacter sp.]|uniref:hypothetical protein n=1 Tax=Glutamicibacter sp. TaxID=1931995 RepID=UPI003D6BDF55
MFLRDLLFSCLRRWYILVLGLVLTGLGSYYIFNAIEPTYEAEGSVVLIPPKVAVTVGDNPYLYLGGLDQALGVLQVKTTSPEVITPIVEKYQGAEVAIAKDATTSGPIAAITVTADTAEDTISLLEDTLASIPATLKTLQADLDVPENSVITSMALSKDQVPEPNSKRQIQFTAFVALGGISASLLGAGLLDRMLLALKKRRALRKLGRGTGSLAVQEGPGSLAPIQPLKSSVQPVEQEPGRTGSETGMKRGSERARLRG